MSLKDRILKSKDSKTALETIPEWDNVQVELRGMGGQTRAKVLDVIVANQGVASESEEAQQAKIGMALMPLFPEIIADGIYDPSTGERVFIRADIEPLADKNGDVLQRLAIKILGLSGLEAKAVDEAGKSSSPDTPSGASTSN